MTAGKALERPLALATATTAAAQPQRLRSSPLRRRFRYLPLVQRTMHSHLSGNGSPPQTG
jgi:hypothetical protein